MSHEISLIDHFLVSEIISDKYSFVKHDALNVSDHSPVFLDIDIGTIVSKCSEINFDVLMKYEKLLWDNYKKNWDEILSCKDNSSEFPLWRDLMCTNCQPKIHTEDLYSYLIGASVLAGRLTILTSKGRSPRKSAIHDR